MVPQKAEKQLQVTRYVKLSFSRPVCSVTREGISYLPIPYSYVPQKKALPHRQRSILKQPRTEAVYVETVERGPIEPPTADADVASEDNHERNKDVESPISDAPLVRQTLQQGTL